MSDTALILCPRDTLTPTIANAAIAAKQAALEAVALIGKITSKEANDQAALAVGNVTALRRSLEKSRKEIKEPYLRACQAIEKAFHSLDDELAAEELRVNTACGDWKMEQIQLQRQAEVERQREIDRIERERKAESDRVAEVERQAEVKRQEEIRKAEREALAAKSKKAREEAEARRLELERVAETERAKAEAQRKERESLAEQERLAVAPVAPIARTEGQKVKPVWTFEVVDSIKLIRGRLDLVRWEPNKEAINEAIAAGVREIPGLKIFEVVKVTASPTSGRKVIDI